MKSQIKKLVPSFLIAWYRRRKRLQQKTQDLNRTTEEVFSDIYEQNRWGGSRGEFCSGAGSLDERIVSAYIMMVFEKAATEEFSGSTFIDLGCGDFHVGEKLIPLCSNYTGVDVVKTLINNNQEKYGNDVIKFTHLNIVEDDLPDGDVCFVRQVFQHLSNQQISAVLPKLKKYKWVFITEHYPADNNNIQTNLDKCCGSDIRAYENSGVYLMEPLEQVLEV